MLLLYVGGLQADVPEAHRLLEGNILAVENRRLDAHGIWLDPLVVVVRAHYVGCLGGRGVQEDIASE